MKLNIINQSSTIELTTYQIAFMESVLQLSKVKRELRFPYSQRFRLEHNIFDENFSLNIPIYLVNENQFKKIKVEYNTQNGIENEPEPVYPEKKHYIPENDLIERYSVKDNDNIDKNLDVENKAKLEKIRKYWERKAKIKRDIENEIGINRNDKYKGKMERTITTEALGLYFANYSNFKSDEIKQPAIFLCMNSISNQAKDHNEFLYLTTLVLLHEIGHHYLNNDNDYHPKDEFYQWMEESYAECFALNMIYNIFDIYDDGDDRHYHSNYYMEFSREYLNYFGKHNINQFIELFDYSKENIISSPKNYQLGYYLFMFGQTREYDYPWKWRMYKAKLSNNKATEKQDWLDYVQNDMIADKGAKLKQLYDAIFANL